MTTGRSPTEAVYWQTHRRKPLPRQLFCQIALWTWGPWAADKLRLCVAACCSAPCLPSSAQSLRRVESTKSTSESKGGKYPAVFLPQTCAISGALWFRLNSKWKQCCFFSFMPPPSSRTACQTTFLWIISDMRDPFQPSLPSHPAPSADTVWPSLGQLIGYTWPKRTLCLSSRKKVQRKLQSLLS